mmetsp:Transcript_3256/g.7601  ORF Transcript_3256/g.7601 Transcript_3256/m.7601 type:complete len:101 (-) Transcript_3256:358-660(-)
MCDRSGSSKRTAKQTKKMDHRDNMTHPGAVSTVNKSESGGYSTLPKIAAMAGPTAMPKPPATTKDAEADDRSDREKVSAMNRRLIDRALPNPLKKRPIMT